jgi:hypothetical protein
MAPLGNECTGESGTQRQFREWERLIVRTRESSGMLLGQPRTLKQADRRGHFV